MSNPEVVGRLVLWAIELSEFDIQYRPRTAIKGQVVADFIPEFTNREDTGADEYLQWSIHTDGSSNRQAAEQVSCFLLLKEIRLNVWSTLTSLPPIMKRNTKL